MKVKKKKFKYILYIASSKLDTLSLLIQISKTHRSNFYTLIHDFSSPVKKTKYCKEKANKRKEKRRPIYEYHIIFDRLAIHVITIKILCVGGIKKIYIQSGHLRSNYMYFFICIN